MRIATLAAAFAVVPMLAVAAPPFVMNCQTISQPGSYVLTRNLASNGDCIVIASDFVTLDLAGFTISGNGTGSAVREQAGVAFPGLHGVVIRNGNVTKFADGISFFSSVGVTVDGVNASFNTNNGVVLGQRAVVRASRFDENGGNGVSVDIGSSLTGNTAGHNVRTGIVAAEGAIVVNNEARNNQMDGISMDCPGAAVANTSGNNAGNNLTQINGSCVSDHNSTL